MTNADTLTRAEDLARELRAHAVRPLIERADETWTLLVPLSDHALACALLGLTAPEILEPEHERPRSARGSWTRNAAGGLLAVGLGVVAVTGWLHGGTADASHWSASGRAYHSDDDADGTIDRVVVRGDDGVPSAVWVDRDRDGVMDRIIQVDRAAGRTAELLDDDGDGYPDLGPGAAGAAGLSRPAPNSTEAP